MFAFFGVGDVYGEICGALGNAGRKIHVCCMKCKFQFKWRAIEQSFRNWIVQSYQENFYAFIASAKVLADTGIICNNFSESNSVTI